MGKIIQPKKRPHIYDAARQLVEHDWDEQEYLTMQYEQFLKAVDVSASKDYQYNNKREYALAGFPIWDEKSTFDEWMRDVQEHIEFRLAELKLRKENSSKSMPHLVTLVRDIQDHSEVGTNIAIDGIGEQMKTEDYEGFEFILRKSLETVIKFRKGQIEINEKKLTPKEVEAILRANSRVSIRRAIDKHKAKKSGKIIKPIGYN